MDTTIRTKFARLTRIRWLARITSLISILVLLVFIAGEEFDPSKISPRQWVGFAFFPVGLIVGFIVGWKREILGGSISLLSLLCFYGVYGLFLSGRFPGGIAFLIFSLPGFIFLAAGFYAEAAIGRSASSPADSPADKKPREDSNKSRAPG
ncbi:MAG: hypothetical protein OEQ28_09810 [Acidobacteriota bacterium]|nr:hypothetical protein [Acidobacteriota bacterium]